VSKPQKRQFIRGNDKLPTGDYVIEWTSEMMADLARCREDILFFAEKYFHIRSVDKGRHVIELYDNQREILKGLQDNRFVSWVASRQVGKTTLVTIYALWLCCFYEDQDIIVVANKESTAKNILKRIQFAYEELDNWLKTGVVEWSKTSVSFANGSNIKISTTSGDAARGESCSCLILDEAAFIRKDIGDEFFKSIVPVISASTKSKFFMVSTPNGTENKFYEYYKNGILGEGDKHWNGWKVYKTMWYDIPRSKGLDTFKKETITSLGGDMLAWRQEFNCEFLDNGASTVDGEVLDMLRNMCVNPLYAYDESDFKVWQEPQPFRTYVMGIDVSEGVGQDASVALVVDITDLMDIRVVASYHTASLLPEVFAERVFQVARYYGNPYLCIEANGVGRTVINTLKTTYNYQYVVNYIKEDGSEDKIRSGIMSHTNSKYTAITNMRYWMNTLRALKIYDLNLVQEFDTFSRKPNGTWGAKSGHHDDRIAALYWALFILETKVFMKYFNVTEFDNVGKPLNYIDSDRQNRSRVGKMMFGGASYGRLSSQPPPMILGNVSFSDPQIKEPSSFISRGWQIVGG
jgi:Terminase large subunit, T4likevirus-type, N-terminal/Terminase RNaseH-like domain